MVGRASQAATQDNSEESEEIEIVVDQEDFSDAPTEGMDVLTRDDLDEDNLRDFLEAKAKPDRQLTEENVGDFADEILQTTNCDVSKGDLVSGINAMIAKIRRDTARGEPLAENLPFDQEPEKLFTP